MNAWMTLLAVACASSLAACGREPPTPTPVEPAQAEVAAVDSPAPVASSPSASVDATSPASSTALAALDTYGEQARALSDAIAARADVATLTGQAEALMALAAEMVPAYVQRQPHCDAYLDAALQVRDNWKQLDHATIERDYHLDGALPKIQNSGVCYHMKDLVTHPATMLVLLSQPGPDYAQSKREIDEVIAHLGVVRTQL
ncbi:hypothetical protein [Lysobacter sp. A3-1-A15]|uniref:hypothetical protein n=1 Tax=Novilysobacter viscosus TaxID=3098602 RepID=UPI002EDA707D